MSEKKNVLLITIDSLRADHVSCLGYHRETTPAIDNLAQTGFLFTQAIANGSTTPTSFPSLLTSSYPSMYGYQPHLSKSRTTIAEVLRASGHHTAAFHSNPYLSRYYGYDRGFDTFEDFIFSKAGQLALKMTTGQIKLKMTKGIDPTTKKHMKLPYLLRGTLAVVREFVNTKLELLKPLPTPYERADLISEKAVLWLGQHTDNFFLWIHYMDSHFPYQPRPEYLHQLQIKGITKSQIIKLRRQMEKKLLGKSVQISDGDLRKVVDLYDGEIVYTDDAIASLLVELEKVGAYDDTLIIVTADHGDEFNEHGEVGHWAKLYDELIRVPLIIKWPSSHGGVVIEEQVQLLDIAPTILDFLGIEKPGGFQGTSLIPLMEGKGRRGMDSTGVISETVHNKGRVPRDGKGKRLTSYRTEEWKYIIDEETGRGELYNLQDDPQEKKNLVDREPQKAAEFRSRITTHIRMEEKSKEAFITVERGRIREKIKDLRKARLT